MELFVVKSEEFLDNFYFVVDEKRLREITETNPKYQRLHVEEELHTLKVFQNGGNEMFDIINGKSYDFFVALVRKTFK